MTDPTAPTGAAALPVVAPPCVTNGDFAAALKRLWPHGDSEEPSLIEGMIAAAPIVFPKYGLTSDLVVCHAMAQFSEECGCGTEIQENNELELRCEGRLTQKAYPDTSTVNYTYENTTSRLKSTLEALGQTKQFGYARDNRLASVRGFSPICGNRHIGGLRLRSRQDRPLGFRF